MTFRFTDLVGRYRLVVTDELVAFVERDFVEPAAPEERAAVREEALREAAGAELEITTDGTFVSRANGQEFYRKAIPVHLREALALEDLSFEKAPGMPVTLRLVEQGTVHATQPGKPVAVFRRI